MVAPSRNWGEVQAELGASPLLPLGLGIDGMVESEATRGVMAINWYTPTGGDVDSINAAVNAALDAVLAPLYYTFKSGGDLNVILGAVAGAGGVDAYISGADMIGSPTSNSIARFDGYLTEHTFERVYQGVSEWI